ncbi:MAG: MFS transporter [Pseudomonadales bacterium]|nr:MFS transporter [Candidatus Woesebacteria bacterium]MCB9800890.1 MFS transporter [Pseudomonadales bacterium]
MKQKGLLTIFLIVFIDLLGFGLILPLLPFIAEKFQANPLQIGLLAAAYSFFQFIAAPIMGRLSDRYGRKKLLFISQLGTVAGFILLGVAHTLPLLFLARIVDGITGGNISIAQAYIADVTTTKDRAKGMGMLGAAFGLGFIFGPALGGFLSQWGFWVPAFFAAGIAGIAAISTALFLEETVDVKAAVTKKQASFSFSKLKETLATPVLGILIGVFFLISLAFSAMQGTFALWSQDTLGWGPTQTGYLFAYIGVMSVIMQLVVLPRVVKRFGERTVFKMSIPLLGLGLAGIPLSIHIGLLLLSTGLLVMGNSLANPTIQSIASENVDKEEYGGTLGFLQSSASLGRILGPVLGGELYAVVSKDAPYVASGLILFVTYLIVQKYIPGETIFEKVKRRFF